MKAAQLETAAAIAANVAYCLVVLSLLIIMFPSLRRPLQHLASRVLYDWRRGIWLAKQPPSAPLPAWVRQIRTGAELPAELEPGG